jgi:hypothetical protein
LKPQVRTTKALTTPRTCGAPDRISGSERQ